MQGAMEEEAAVSFYSYTCFIYCIDQFLISNQYLRLTESIRFLGILNQ